MRFDKQSLNCNVRYGSYRPKFYFIRGRPTLFKISHNKRPEVLSLGNSFCGHKYLKVALNFSNITCTFPDSG